MQESLKKNVLIILSVMGQFPEMFRLAKLLKSSSSYNPIFYFNLGVDFTHENVRLCFSEGIDVLDYHKGYIQAASGKNAIAMAISESSSAALRANSNPEKLSLKQWLKINCPQVLEVLKQIYYLRYRLSFLNLPLRIIVMRARRRKETLYLNTLNIRLLIFAEDSVDYFTPLLIRLGHNNGIKSVVFPYTFANQFEFLEDAFFNDRRVNRTIMNFITGRLFPKWTYRYKGKNLIKSTPSLIFSTEYFKLTPPNPWVMSSGFSDLVAVESTFMKDYYRKAGLPEEKMLVTGHLSLDALHFAYENRAAHRKNLFDSLHLDENKPIILCSMPPTQWPRPARGFESYTQFLEAFLGFLNQFKSVNIVFKFHPRVSSFEMSRIAASYNIKYSLDDTTTLVAAADMYIASVSSTMRWSLALGLPTINYDVYNYGYGDFDGSVDYETASTFEDFKLIFSKQVTNLINGNFKGKPQQKGFGQLDGKVGECILSLFDKLTES